MKRQNEDGYVFISLVVSDSAVRRTRPGSAERARLGVPARVYGLNSPPDPSNISLPTNNELPKRGLGGAEQTTGHCTNPNLFTGNWIRRNLHKPLPTQTATKGDVKGSKRDARASKLPGVHLIEERENIELWRGG